MASRIFRTKLRSFVRYVFFTYCWVIVEPPWRISRLLMSAQAARTIPSGSIPLWVKKSRSSVATTASISTWGIWS